MSETKTRMSEHAALKWVFERSPLTIESYPQLAEVFGWQRTKCWRVVKAWQRKGWVECETSASDGRITIRVIPNVVPIEAERDADDDEEQAGANTGSLPFREGTSMPPAVQTEAERHPVQAANEHREPAEQVVYARYVNTPRERGPRGEGHSSHDVAALLAAGSLTLVAAWMSVHGMLVLFPGDLFAACWLGLSLEGSKIAAASWLGRHHADSHWGYVILLVLCVLGTATLNATGVYSRLVAAHVGPAGAAAAGMETSDAEAGARVETASARVADIDKRLASIDGVIEGAAKRGKARTAEAVMRDQRKARAELASERESAVKELAGLKASRAGMAAKGHAAEAESAPIQYVAQLFGITRGGEEVIRWFIAGVVAMGDPFALLMIAAVSARRRRTA